MKPRERVVAALRGQTPDAFPWSNTFSAPACSRNCWAAPRRSTTAPANWRWRTSWAWTECGFPVNGFCGVEEEVHPIGASYQDEWGVTYVKHGWPIMVQTDTPINSRADWERYTMPRRERRTAPRCWRPR